MSHVYLDASAVVKRYSPETGTAWVRALTDPTAGHTMMLGDITLAEVAAAIAAKHRAPDGITVEERDNAVALFLSHCMTYYELIAVNRAIIDPAVNLTLNHKLRGYDAVQLATALVANEALTTAALVPLIFVTADTDLVTAAGAEGLATENPNLHVTSQRCTGILPLDRSKGDCGSLIRQMSYQEPPFATKRGLHHRPAGLAETV